MTKSGFVHIQGLSEPGNLDVANQDRWGHTDDAIWVIDGATNLDKIAVSPGGDDGEWLAATLNEFLLNVDWTQYASTVDALQEASIQMRKQYAEWLEDAPVRPSTQPSATLALVRELDTATLEYTVLGDCSMTVLDHADNNMAYITTSDLSALDNLALGELAGLMANGLTFAEARAGIQDTLVRNRNKMNAPGGYWVFSLDPLAIEHSKQGTIPVSGRMELMLASDGFSRLWDVFGITEPGRQSWELVRTKGPNRVLDIIRQAERADANIAAYPRFKISDDASVVIGRFCGANKRH